MSRPKAELVNSEQVDGMYKYYARSKRPRFARAARAVLNLVLRPRVTYLDGAEASLRDHKGPLVVVANHTDNLDPPVLAAATSKIKRLKGPAAEHSTVPAKASLFNTPVIGAIVTRLGALPTFRPKDSDNKDLRKHANAEMMKINQSVLRDHPIDGAVFIFPEGTRNRGEPGKVQQLRPGVVELLHTNLERDNTADSEEPQEQVGALPIGIAYGGLFRFLRPHVVVGPVIYPQVGEDQRTLESIRDGMQETVTAAHDMFGPQELEPQAA